MSDKRKLAGYIWEEKEEPSVPCHRCCFWDIEYGCASPQVFDCDNNTIFEATPAHGDIVEELAEALEELIHSYDAGSLRGADKALAKFNEQRGEG